MSRRDVMAKVARRAGNVIDARHHIDSLVVLVLRNLSYEIALGDLDLADVLNEVLDERDSVIAELYPNMI